MQLANFCEEADLEGWGESQKLCQEAGSMRIRVCRVDDLDDLSRNWFLGGHESYRTCRDL